MEEVDPQVPMHRDPQESLADGDEGGHLRNGVRGEVVKLHPVMVAQPPHEPARGTVEATLGSSPAGVNCPPSTNASNDSRSAVDWGHGKGSNTRIGAMAEEMGNTGSGGSKKCAGGSETARCTVERKMKCVRDACEW
jgi:hypothetical protein